MIPIESIAPNFSLYDTDKNKFNLFEQKGNNVLILFFPLAFTSVCTKELCNIKDNLGIYNNANAKVVAISVDSVATLSKFKIDQGLNFTLLSDFNKEVSMLYNVLYETFILEMKGVSKRAAFIVNKQGIIKYSEVLENAGLMPNFDKIIEILNQLNN